MSTQILDAQPDLRLGDTGPAVRLAQELLNRDGALLVDDGQFGHATLDALQACQLRRGVAVTGMIDAATWTMLRTIPEPCPGIDSRAVTFIAREEVGSCAYYSRYCAQPSWPGEQSGITIGIGYDMRFARDFQGDWGDLLPADDMAMLRPWLGEIGSETAALSLCGIVVPWQAAWTVFVRRTLPATLKATCAAFPGTDRLPLLSAGALVSLVYNRGPALSGPNRQEMREIRNALQAGKPAQVPDCIRSMARLWPNSPGLQARRAQEAELFAQGLREAA